jgi:hypothetical protein
MKNAADPGDEPGFVVLLGDGRGLWDEDAGCGCVMFL